MDNNWKSFNKHKPPLAHRIDNGERTDKILLLIDGEIYLGYYINQVVSDDNKKELLKWIECAFFSFDELNSNDFIEILGETEFNKHDIYWHELNIHEILSNIVSLESEN